MELTPFAPRTLFVFVLLVSPVFASNEWVSVASAQGLVNAFAHHATMHIEVTEHLDTSQIVTSGSQSSPLFGPL